MHSILANTSLDQDFRDSFQDNAVGHPDNFKFAKVFGEAYIVVPAALGLWAIDEFIDRQGWFPKYGAASKRRRAGHAKRAERSLLVHRQTWLFKC